MKGRGGGRFRGTRFAEHRDGARGNERYTTTNLKSTTLSRHQCLINRNQLLAFDLSHRRANKERAKGTRRRRDIGEWNGGFGEWRRKELDGGGRVCVCGGGVV